MMERAEVLRGAAYRVLFEKTDPDGCVDQDKFASVARVLDEVDAWSHTQAPEISVAYRLAIGEIRQRAKTTLENNERWHQLVAAYETIPRP